MPVNGREELKDTDYKLIVPWPQAVGQVEDCVPPMSVSQRRAVPKYVARISRNDTGYCLQQGCLACSIRPDKAEHFSCTHIKGDIDQRSLLAVAFAQSCNLQQRRRRLRSLHTCDSGRCCHPFTLISVRYSGPALLPTCDSLGALCARSPTGDRRSEHRIERQETFCAQLNFVAREV